MKILGIIPARGGSVGIPRKNLALLGSKPLLAYAIEAALGAQSLHHCIVSTDDAEIAEVAEKWGAEVPFMRPKELAQNDTPTVAVLRDVLERLPEYDVIVTIQPTAPLRQAIDIDNAVALLLPTVSAVVSVCEVAAHQHPYWLHRLQPETGELLPYDPEHFAQHTRRQSLPKLYSRNGAVYVSRRENIFKHNNLYGEQVHAYLMPAERSVNIDSPLDLWMASFYLQAGQ